MRDHSARASLRAYVVCTLPLGTKNINNKHTLKNLGFLILFPLLIVRSYSQGYGTINFDDSVNLFRIRIDSTIPNNIWQIGAPNKHIFSVAHSIPNAIITDTLNSYPINNNSDFYLVTPGDFFSKYHAAKLDFWYMMDSDTLIDYGKIEISIGASQIWHNIISGNGLYGYYWIYDSQGNLFKQTGPNDTLIFDGTSNGWYKFIYTTSLPEYVNIDSIRYRFTFHSSGIFGSRDGWMIDDFDFHDEWESTFEKGFDYTVYPDPVQEQLNINSQALVIEYEIMNSMGQVLDRNNNDLLPAHINVSYLIPGFYFYKLKFLSGKECFGKFIKI